MLGPANRPGHHDRRSTRPAAGHAMPATEQLPGGTRRHRPPRHPVRVRITKPDGDDAYRLRGLAHIPGRHAASGTTAPSRGHASRAPLVTPEAVTAAPISCRSGRQSAEAWLSHRGDHDVPETPN